MINLIPPHARKQVRLEYWIRVVSLWMMLVSTALIAVGFLLVPSIVLMKNQMMVYSDEYNIADAQNETYTQLQLDVTLLNTLAKVLIENKTPILFSQLISGIKNHIDDNIFLTSISSSRNEEGKIENIEISGNANSRKSLVEFRDNLELDPMFESVYLPISNLAKDKYVTFSLQIVINNNL